MKIITIRGKRYCWSYTRTILAALIIAAIAGAVTFAMQEPADQAIVYKSKSQLQIEQQENCVAIKGQAIPAVANVPLDAELQKFIWSVSEDYELDPRLVLSVIGQESGYYAKKIGDDGKSFGLMQVQEKYHADRMDKLDAVDLLDPYDNVIVGVDYLSECIERGGLEWGLMCYNGGPDYADAKTASGIKTEYVEGVLYLYESMGGTQ